MKPFPPKPPGCTCTGPVHFEGCPTSYNWNIRLAESTANAAAWRSLMRRLVDACEGADYTAIDAIVKELARKLSNADFKRGTE